MQQIARPSWHNRLFIEVMEARRLLSAWYVSPAGADGNPGTLGEPFATIARGMDAALPGDTVYLRGGTYRETLSSVRSGLPGQPITVSSYNNEAVYLSASDVVGGPWTETAPGSGIYTAATAGSLPTPFWSTWGISANGTGTIEAGGSLVATVTNESTYATTAARSIRGSSAWNFFAQSVTWRVRGLSIASVGSNAIPLDKAYTYFTFMPTTAGGWEGDDSINVQYSGNGALRLLMKKNTVNSWGTSYGVVTSAGVSGFDLVLGPVGPGSVAYTLVAYPTGQVVANGQWALNAGEWSDGGDGSTSYLQVFTQEGVTANDLNQRFEMRVGSIEAATAGGTIFSDTFSDGDLTTADYFPSGRDTSITSGYDQIFVDGEMQHEARFPNKTSDDLLNPDTAALTMGNTYAFTGTAFSGKAADFFAGSRFLGRVGEGWSWQTAVVTSSSSSSVQLNSATASSWWWPNFDNATSQAGIGYVYGKLAFLDADREWHLQVSGDGPDVLYVRLPGGANPAGHAVERKARNWTVNINGHNHIVLRGLNFRGGAVRLNGSGLVLEESTARYLSHYLTFSNGGAIDGGHPFGGGIVVSGSGNTVQRNTVYDTGGSGVVVSGTNHLLTRNHIYNTDYSGTYGTGMNLAGSGHTATFNTIHDSGRDILRPNGAGMTVMYNDLWRAGRMALDLGLVYTWGANGADANEKKTRIAYNWVHDRGGSDTLSTGIYLDNFDRNFIVDHNVVWGITGSGFNPVAMRLNSPMVGVEIYHNTLIQAPSYNVSTYSSFPGTNPDPSFWTTANHGMDYVAQNNWVIPSTADPATLFENYAGRDFRPKAGTAAINPATTTGLTSWTTTNGTTNVPSTFRLYQNTTNQTFRYREVTGQGVVVPGINDGYLGATPDSGAYEAGGTYWIPGVNGTADATAPVLSGVTVNAGAAQRSVVTQVGVVFSEAVTLDAGAVTVKLASGNAVPNVTITPTNPSGDGRTWVLTFAGTGVIGGSLPDGIYDLVITASGVRDLAGNALTASYSQRFHRLFGDTNGDKRVNLIDHRSMRATLGRPAGDPLFNAALDFDGSGAVTVLDLSQFRRRYGMRYGY